MRYYAPDKIKEQYVSHQKVSVYVVSDYFGKNYNPSTPSKKVEESESREKEKKWKRRWKGKRR